MYACLCVCTGICWLSRLYLCVYHSVFCVCVMYVYVYAQVYACGGVDCPDTVALHIPGNGGERIFQKHLRLGPPRAHTPSRLIVLFWRVDVCVVPLPPRLSHPPPYRHARVCLTHTCSCGHACACASGGRPLPSLVPLGMK